MQEPNSWCYSSRPAARTTAQVEAFSPWWQTVEWKNSKIGLERLLIFASSQGALVKGGPFATKSVDGRLVQICSGHTVLPISGSPLWRWHHSLAMG